MLLMILLLSALVRMFARLSSCATSMCFIFPIPCRCRKCSVAFASMINTGFTAKHKSHIMLSTPFASDAPNAAAYSSVSTLLLAMIFCFLMYTYRRCRPTSATPALDDFLVSLSQAQSESEETVTSVPMSPNSKTWIHCLSPVKCFNLLKLCCEGSYHSLAHLVHGECYVCSVMTE